MRTLEEIKFDHIVSKKKPSKEEMYFYSITENMLKKWRTIDVLKFQKKLYEAIDEVILYADDKLQVPELNYRIL